MAQLPVIAIEEDKGCQNVVVLAQPVREILSEIEIGMFYKITDCCRPKIDSDVISCRI